MHRRAGRVRWVVGGLLCFLALGCGQKPQPTPVKVSGQLVAENRKSLPPLLLHFHPQEDKNKNNLNQPAQTATDGTFTCECLPGRYKITVSLLPGTGAPSGAGPVTFPAEGPTPRPSPPATPAISIPPRYQSSYDTPWEIDVSEDGTDVGKLTLKKF